MAQARARLQLAAGDLAGAAAFYRRAEAAGGATAEAIRLERRAVEVWLDPEPPEPPSDRSRPSEDWTAALRRATHAEPRLVATSLLASRSGPVSAERLAGALATLLAGDIDESRRLLGELTREVEGHPAVPVIARFVRVLVDTIAVATQSANVELEMVIADAERLDLPGLAALASLVVDLLSASSSDVAWMVDARDRAGDQWGALLVALVGGILSARADARGSDGDGEAPADVGAVDLLDRRGAAGPPALGRRARGLGPGRLGRRGGAGRFSGGGAGRDDGGPCREIRRCARSRGRRPGGHGPGARAGQDEHRAAAEALAAATSPSGAAT